MNEFSKLPTPKFEKDGLYFLPLGGAGEIGMNLSLYKAKGKWLMVDLGLTFGNERTSPGVDLIMPDPTFIEERKADLVGLVLTHVHEDHLGAVPYLWPDLGCPIYASPFTAAFLRHKLREEGLEDEVELIEVAQGDVFDVGPFSLELVATTHSTPEASHLLIATPAGKIFHTADWKHDPEPLVGSPVDEERLKAIGDEGIDVLVGDSTNIFSTEHTGSEGEVRRALIELFADYEQQIIVGCFASNIARIESIAIAARENGREVALAGRSLWRMVETARSVGYLTDAPRFLTDEEASRLPRSKVVYISTGSQGEPRAALKRIATGTHPYIQVTRGDVVVFSSRVIPGNERRVLDVQNDLARRGVNIITAQDAMIHVSGHPGLEDVKALYRAVRPRMVLPVHGEPMHINEHVLKAVGLGVDHVITVFDGEVVRLDGAAPGVVGEVFSGRLALDGDRLIPMESELLKDRRKMALNGAVAVSVVLDAKGRLKGDLVISARGLYDPIEDEDELDSLSRDVVRALEHLSPRDRVSDSAVTEAVRLSVRRYFRRVQGRKPIVDTHIVRI